MRCSHCGTAGTGCARRTIRRRTRAAWSPTWPAPGSAARCASAAWITLFWSQREDKTENPDIPGVVDVQDALRRLPFRKRACVVLRHAFDLSEKDTALALGISVGTVKSQTSKGMAELKRLLGTDEAPMRVHVGALPTTGGAGGRDR